MLLKCNNNYVPAKATFFIAHGNLVGSGSQDLEVGPTYVPVCGYVVHGQ
jgi:hypothetical protein